MNTRISSVLAALSVLCVSAPAFQLPTPAEHLGHPLAADFYLPDWAEVLGYYAKLDAASARVSVFSPGKTQDGRDMLLAALSSEQNLAQLDELKKYAHLLADPRGASDAQLAEAQVKGKVFVFISCAMHATECAAPQFGMQLAYTLASSEEEPWKSVREHCVVLLLPSMNPDGLDDVAHWYMKYVGTPYEGTELDKLYQHYAGHDNNRDWFALGLAETRVVSKLLYQEWFPQVYWDVHQQGSKAERMFVPPFRDPLDPNLDANVIDGINTLGMRAMFDMTREGQSGVSWGGTFDMWWNGGNRNVPVRHNIIGLLTEAASCRLASPIFLSRNELSAPDGLKEYAPSNRFPEPWPGGWWRLADIVDYEMGFAKSLLGSLARERGVWLSNKLQVSHRALRRAKDMGVKGWLIPADNENRGGVERMCEVLAATGVELDTCEQASGIDGRLFSSGSTWIDAAQPCAMHAKDLFDVQRYPGVEQPYDVAGWTLPELFGVRVVECVSEAKLGKLSRRQPKPAASSDAYSVLDSEGWRRAFAKAKEGGAVQLGGAKLRFPAETEPGTLVATKLPRIGLYSPWSGNTDEGWMRWVFERFGVPYVSVRNEQLRAGKLSDFLDVLVLPGVGERELEHGRAQGTAPPELTGGLEAQGAVAVEEFVRGGGNLVAIGGSAKWAIELFQLPLADVTTGEGAKDFSCPGSILRCVPTDAPLAAGIPASQSVFFSRSSAWRLTDPKNSALEVLLRYAPSQTLVSGWIAKPEVIAGQAAWVRASVERGHVHLFGFRPQYRGWSEAAFPLVFRALLFDNAKESAR
ncbi:MAG: peptidase M14 [Planctomycetes bacterium]|nr:peptidase M14 [Planctomycetota bacterium]